MDASGLMQSGQARERRRRRRPSSYQEENNSGVSREENTSPISNKFEEEKEWKNGIIQDALPRKKKSRRREDDITERPLNGNSYQQRSSKDHPRQRKESPSKRMPRSVSEEVLAMEGKFAGDTGGNEDARVHTRKARRTRRREPTDQTLEQGHEDSGTASGDYHSVERNQQKARTRPPAARKKKKVRTAAITSGDEDNYQADVDGEVSEIFKVDKEDIVAFDTAVSPTRVPALSAPTLPSQPLDFLFIEKKDGQGFVKEHKTKLPRVEEEESEYAKEMLDTQRNQTSIDLALQIHLAFRTFALFCHGVLAGFALTQCIFVYMLSDVNTTNFLTNYYKLARPFQSLYYFLLTICTVSVFDRFANVGTGCRQFFLSLLTYPSRALALIVYLVALLFSLGLAQMDDRISLYNEDPSLWSSTGRISTWKILNMFRVVGAIAGWMFVSLGPVDDQTARNLSIITEQEKSQTRLDRDPDPFPI